MLPQGQRRRWYDGWQITAAAAALLSAVVYTLTQPVETTRYVFHPDPRMLAVTLGAALLGALLWLPIAYVTWRPYAITEPGLDAE